MRVFDKQQADMQKLEDFVRVNKANGVAASAKSKKKARPKEGRGKEGQWRRSGLRLIISTHPCISSPAVPHLHFIAS